MEITEVRIKLVERSSERLRAFCSVTFDGDFVIRDLKVIDGANGPFVAMPSRKLMDRCPRCGGKNHLRARFCNECGNRLNENRAPKDNQGRAKLHADVAHPINAACRERIQKAVVQAYHEELERAKSPDYKPTAYDDYDDYEDTFEPGPGNDAKGPQKNRTERNEDTKTMEERSQPADHGFGDYNELIADLKRQAHHRRNRRSEPSPAQSAPKPPPAPSPSSGDQDQPSGPPSGEDRQSLSETVRWTSVSPPDPDEEFGSGLL